MLVLHAWPASTDHKIRSCMRWCVSMPETIGPEVLASLVNCASWHTHAYTGWILTLTAWHLPHNCLLQWTNHRRCACLSAMLLPLRLLTVALKKKGGGKKKGGVSVASHIVLESLKLSKKDSDQVLLLHQSLPELCRVHTAAKGVRLRCSNACCFHRGTPLSLMSKHLLVRSPVVCKGVQPGGSGIACPRAGTIVSPPQINHSQQVQQNDILQRV